MRRRAGLAAVALAAIALASSAAPASAQTSVSVQQFGTSVQARPIRVAKRCGADARVDVLVVGVIHGNEAAGLPVVSRLARTAPPRGLCLWLLASLNPDGQRLGTRQNARGVDLNRNFPFDWRGGGSAFDTYYPGRARASEPETRAALAMIRAIHPDVTVWYHQHMNLTVRPPLPWRQALASRYASVSGVPMRTYPGGRLYGTASSWQHAEQRLSAALVVELPAGSLTAAAIRRHVAAVLAVGAAAAADGVA
jgi:protein MpaA